MHKLTSICISFALFQASFVEQLAVIVAGPQVTTYPGIPELINIPTTQFMFILHRASFQPHFPHPTLSVCVTSPSVSPVTTWNQENPLMYNRISLFNEWLSESLPLTQPASYTVAVVTGHPEYAQEMSVMTGLRWIQQGRKNFLIEGDLSEVKKKYCI